MVDGNYSMQVSLLDDGYQVFALLYVCEWKLLKCNHDIKIQMTI